MINPNNKTIYLWGALSLIVASIFSTGFYHFDEHFQILEFAGLKLGLTSAENLPWEYHYQMRPSFQPFIVFLTHKFWGLFGVESPFFITFFLRLLSAGLTFLSMLLLYNLYERTIKDQTLQRWYVLLSFLLWFAIFNGVRFSSENWSGLVFIFGFSYYFLARNKNAKTYFLIGILLGISFLCRYQIAFMIAGFILWLLLIKKERFIHLTYIAFGILLIFALGVCLDRWFYGHWTLSTWNYFALNILEDKASNFGVEPWWWYITKSIESGIPPFSLLFIGAIVSITILKPKNPIIWSFLPFIVIHSIIGHKELRFMFPLIGFLPIITIQSLQLVQQRFAPNLIENKCLKGFMKVLFAVNFVALLIVSLRAVDGQISLYHTLYKNYSEPTTLYYTSKNPYIRATDIYYYKRKNLTIKQIKTIEEMPVNGNSLIVLEKRDKLNTPEIGKLVYSTFPTWIMKINFNNWVNRTNAWCVYEVNPETIN